jgi:hypothetical protein
MQRLDGLGLIRPAFDLMSTVKSIANPHIQGETEAIAAHL